MDGPECGSLTVLLRHKRGRGLRLIPARCRTLSCVPCSRYLLQQWCSALTKVSDDEMVWFGVASLDSWNTLQRRARREGIRYLRLGCRDRVIVLASNPLGDALPRACDLGLNRESAGQDFVRFSPMYKDSLSICGQNGQNQDQDFCKRTPGRRGRPRTVGGVAGSYVTAAEAKRLLEDLFCWIFPLRVTNHRFVGVEDQGGSSGKSQWERVGQGGAKFRLAARLVESRADSLDVDRPWVEKELEAARAEVEEPVCRGCHEIIPVAWARVHEQHIWCRECAKSEGGQVVLLHRDTTVHHDCEISPADGTSEITCNDCGEVLNQPHFCSAG